METGAILFEQGELPNCQYVVVSGAVQLSGHSMAGREVLIETLAPPELISPATVLTSSPYLVRARVSEPSRLLVIDAELFRATAMREPGLAWEVQISLSCQFRRMLRQIKNLKLRDTKERVGCYLLALADRQGTPGLAVLPYEKSLIATELGMTRESFSRALSALKAHGLSVRGDRIVIEDAHRLASECRPDPLIDESERLSELDVVQQAPQRASKAARA
jgi:CRP/FNR family transcriptional activator FtrB